MADWRDRREEAATGAANRPPRQAPPGQPILPQVAAGQPGATSTATPTHGRRPGEAATSPAPLEEGKLEVVATPVSEAAATTTGEVSLAEAGGGPGAA
ncbi:MAG: hypothetical protein ACK559_31585, partial [bacterium]